MTLTVAQMGGGRNTLNNVEAPSAGTIRVLAVAYAVSPYRGSEFGMGWNFVRALAPRCELHVITGTESQDDTERWLAEHPDERSHFHFYYIHMPYRQALCRLWPPSYYWYYRRWMQDAYQLAQTLHAEHPFDLTHQLNMIGYREPGYLWRLGLPHVWGPVGGFGLTEWRMLPSMGPRGCLFYFMRNVINLLQMHTSRRVREAALASRALLAATQDNHDALLRLYRRESTLLPEVGLTEAPTDARPHQRREGEPMRVCWSGVFEPRKSLNLLLEALARGPRDVVVDVIGEGRMSRKWRRMSQRLGLEGRVVWHGWVARADALALMQRADAFCITSLSDATSTVLLEALSLSLPVVTLDHCGFANVVTPECGIKVSVETPRQVVRDLRAALTRLAADEPLRRQLAQGARQRALEYNWEHKADVICQMYDEAVTGGAGLQA